ncbi:uncharacterized protein KRP23_8608 [Phytophthora ramorum]|uniref:uncharacterized protein n=1 Tax=Phytophthora ramorum TaxID=164328 RepID=UPI0030B7C121|nr:hypothetical protein KRP23_8608 [Phytophthora ramorum]
MEHAHELEAVQAETITLAHAFNEEMEHNATTHKLALDHATLEKKFDGDMHEVLQQLKSIRQAEEQEQIANKTQMEQELRLASLRECSVQTEVSQRADAATSAALFVDTSTSPVLFLVDAGVQHDATERKIEEPFSAVDVNNDLEYASDEDEDSYEETFEKESQVRVVLQTRDNESTSEVPSYEESPAHYPREIEEENESEIQSLPSHREVKDSFDESYTVTSIVEQSFAGASMLASVVESTIDDEMNENHPNEARENNGDASASMDYEDDFEASSPKMREVRGQIHHKATVEENIEDELHVEASGSIHNNGYGEDIEEEADASVLASVVESTIDDEMNENHPNEARENNGDASASMDYEDDFEASSPKMREVRGQIHHKATVEENIEDELHVEASGSIHNNGYGEDIEEEADASVLASVVESTIDDEMNENHPNEARENNGDASASMDYEDDFEASSPKMREVRGQIHHKATVEENIEDELHVEASGSIHNNGYGEDIEEEADASVLASVVESTIDDEMNENHPNEARENNGDASASMDYEDDFEASSPKMREVRGQIHHKATVEENIEDELHVEASGSIHNNGYGEDIEEEADASVLASVVESTIDDEMNENHPNEARENNGDASASMDYEDDFEASSPKMREVRGQIHHKATVEENIEDELHVEASGSIHNNGYGEDIEEEADASVLASVVESTIDDEMNENHPNEARENNGDASASMDYEDDFEASSPKMREVRGQIHHKATVEENIEDELHVEASGSIHNNGYGEDIEEEADASVLASVVESTIDDEMNENHPNEARENNGDASASMDYEDDFEASSPKMREVRGQIHHKATVEENIEDELHVEASGSIHNNGYGEDIEEEADASVLASVVESTIDDEMNENHPNEARENNGDASASMDYEDDFEASSPKMREVRGQIHHKATVEENIEDELHVEASGSIHNNGYGEDIEEEADASVLASVVESTIDDEMNENHPNEARENNGDASASMDYEDDFEASSPKMREVRGQIHHKATVEENIEDELHVEASGSIHNNGYGEDIEEEADASVLASVVESTIDDEMNENHPNEARENNGDASASMDYEDDFEASSPKMREVRGQIHHKATVEENIEDELHVEASGSIHNNGYGEDIEEEADASVLASVVESTIDDEMNENHPNEARENNGDASASMDYEDDFEASSPKMREVRGQIHHKATVEENIEDELHYMKEEVEQYEDDFVSMGEDTAARKTTVIIDIEVAESDQIALQQTYAVLEMQAELSTIDLLIDFDFVEVAETVDLQPADEIRSQESDEMVELLDNNCADYETFEDSSITGSLQRNEEHMNESTSVVDHVANTFTSSKSGSRTPLEDTTTEDEGAHDKRRCNEGSREDHEHAVEIDVLDSTEAGVAVDKDDTSPFHKAHQSVDSPDEAVAERVASLLYAGFFKTLEEDIVASIIYRRKVQSQPDDRELHGPEKLRLSRMEDVPPASSFSDLDSPANEVGSESLDSRYTTGWSVKQTSETVLVASSTKIDTHSEGPSDGAPEEKKIDDNVVNEPQLSSVSEKGPNKNHRLEDDVEIPGDFPPIEELAQGSWDDFGYDASIDESARVLVSSVENDVEQEIAAIYAPEVSQKPSYCSEKVMQSERWGDAIFTIIFDETLSSELRLWSLQEPADPAKSSPQYAAKSIGPSPPVKLPQGSARHASIQDPRVRDRDLVDRITGKLEIVNGEIRLPRFDTFEVGGASSTARALFKTIEDVARNCFSSTQQSSSTLDDASVLAVIYRHIQAEVDELLAIREQSERELERQLKLLSDDSETDGGLTGDILLSQNCVASNVSSIVSRVQSELSRTTEALSTAARPPQSGLLPRTPISRAKSTSILSSLQIQQDQELQQRITGMILSDLLSGAGLP